MGMVYIKKNDYPKGHMLSAICFYKKNIIPIKLTLKIFKKENN